MPIPMDLPTQYDANSPDMDLANGAVCTESGMCYVDRAGVRIQINFDKFPLTGDVRVASTDLVHIHTYYLNYLAAVQRIGQPLDFLSPVGLFQNYLKKRMFEDQWEENYKQQSMAYVVYRLSGDNCILVGQGYTANICVGSGGVSRYDDTTASDLSDDAEHLGLLAVRMMYETAGGDDRLCDMFKSLASSFPSDKSIKDYLERLDSNSLDYSADANILA